jgi:hypothetical protein
VQGEPFAAATASGPELSGMGAHHPAEYFAEAIMNPNAVLVDGPGYIGPDGYSTMPTYPDLTITQLADLVAYISSLGGAGDAQGGDHSHHAMGEVALPRLEQPAAPQSDASSFFVQTYELQEGKLRDFEEWFRTTGAPTLLAQDGLLTIETYVDNTRPGPALTTVFGFRTDAARERFLASHELEGIQTQFDAFIGPHPHRSYRRPPVYKAPSLSAP